jgi:AraC family transcriptional regulator
MDLTLYRHADPHKCRPGCSGRTASRSFGPANSPTRISILNGFAREFVAFDRDGAFSLKWIPRGAARYEVDRLRHHLAGDKVLLLQPGQPYEVEFLDRKGTESFCLFFSEAMLNEALAAREMGCDTEPPAGGCPAHRQFADMVFTPPVDLTSILRRLRSSVGDPNGMPERLEETLLGLLSDLIAVGYDHRRMAENIPARRSNTRRRLLGRLQRAREMIEDHQGRPPSLEELASASCLSKFHFLRLFKAVFSASPMEYAERCRVERGKSLLQQTPLSIGQVAERLGYQSQGAFAKTFRRHVGVSPRLFRAG